MERNLAGKALITDFIKLENRILPFIFASSAYMQAFNKDYIDYDFLSNAIKEVKPDNVVYSITERTLIEKKVPKDPVFRMLGRYALGMNENFIFPEDLSSPYIPISDKDGNLSVHNTPPFPIYINKYLKTDDKGNIYISFRYSSPNNAREAVLEWTSDKEFKADIKRSAVKIGGGMQSISFHIKDKPEQTIYARITPGAALGKYEFHEIKELRNPINIRDNKGQGK